MELLVLAVIATAGSAFLTLMIFWANMMSDAVAEGFQGAEFIIVAWVITIGLYVWWWFTRTRRKG